MKSFSPFPSLRIRYSHRKDGSFRKLQTIKSFIHNEHPGPISFINLEHSNRIVAITDRLEHNMWGDVLITNVPEQLLALVVADCFPVVLFDPVHHASALIHAGWKSLAKQIIALSIEAMHNTFQSKPEELQAWIGPGICEVCYIQLNKPDQIENSDWQKVIKQTENGYSVDLALFINNELQKAGVKKGNIQNEQLCTYTEKELFFSHRRTTNTGDEEGRYFVTTTLTP